AGKSILLGAIGLLLGQRADTKSIRNGAQRCVIEATFDLANYQMEHLFEEMDIDFDGKECIIRRELTASGKSRAFINDTPTGLSQLKELGDNLIDIHSQHKNLLLAKEDFQLNVLDIIAHDQKEINEYAQTYRKYKLSVKKLEEARRMAEEQQTEQDYLEFQLQQLEEAGLKEGEDEELEREQQTLEHAEEIKTALYQANDLLQGEGSNVIQMLRSASQKLESITHVFEGAEELAERVESTRIELKDVAEELENQAEDIEYNPSRQAFVEERLSLIYDLERKYHAESLEELILIKEELEDRFNAITHSEENIMALEKESKELETFVFNLAAKLSEKRKKSAKIVEKTMSETLISLGMPNIQFQVDISDRTAPDSTGMDKVTFLFCANKNGMLQPISHVASGGEIARVMLSLKALISGAISLPTIIFDEIDTGVSGQIAEQMALIMKEMGEKHDRQVISITHLPQIAALGAHHYRVYKEDNEEATNSHIIKLNNEERVEEIAHMLSGSILTEAAINNARALINK
ncbi:MAG: DNA repair protein RecN, partial [Bacteroidaceae bacterium]|nr:DNA repair protein RecN [Bacteroidaceae bacterium]